MLGRQVQAWIQIRDLDTLTPDEANVERQAGLRQVFQVKPAAGCRLPRNMHACANS